MAAGNGLIKYLKKIVGLNYIPCIKFSPSPKIGSSSPRFFSNKEFTIHDGARDTIVDSSSANYLKVTTKY